MRPLALPLCFVLVAAAAETPSLRAQRPQAATWVGDDDARIDRLERWLKAVAHHEPGHADQEAIDVGSWSQRDLQTLWIDVDVLVKLMRNRGALQFTIPPGQRAPQPTHYKKPQLRRLKTLACASVGAAVDRHCVEIGAAADLDADLLRLSSLAHAARSRGDGDNYVLRRGALLHTDVAMLVAHNAIDPVSTPPSSLGPQRFRLQISDGRQTDFGPVAVHWEFARMVLDRVKPAGGDAPAPGRDEMVRQWYRATAAWMQAVEDHDTVHLDRARELFPADPGILFLSGSQRETYAGPRIQNAVRTAALPSGVSFALASDRGELRQAEGFLRRALEIEPGHVEARLRLGRVLGLLGRHADAARELRQAVASVDEDVLRYYGELFLGAEEEPLGHYDAAFDAYQQAAALYPAAQSPWLALSSLGRRRGDRAAALQALRHLFDLPSTGLDVDDPWWTYHVAQARNVEDLLETLRRPFLAEHER